MTAATAAVAAAAVLSPPSLAPSSPWLLRPIQHLALSLAHPFSGLYNGPNHYYNYTPAATPPSSILGSSSGSSRPDWQASNSSGADVAGWYWLSASQLHGRLQAAAAERRGCGGDGQDADVVGADVAGAGSLPQSRSSSVAATLGSSDAGSPVIPSICSEHQHLDPGLTRPDAQSPAQHGMPPSASGSSAERSDTLHSTGTFLTTLLLTPTTSPATSVAATGGSYDADSPEFTPEQEAMSALGGEASGGGQCSPEACVCLPRAWDPEVGMGGEGGRVAGAILSLKREKGEGYGELLEREWSTREEAEGGTSMVLTGPQEDREEGKEQGGWFSRKEKHAEKAQGEEGGTWREGYKHLHQQQQGGDFERPLHQQEHYYSCDNLLFFSPDSSAGECHLDRSRSSSGGSSRSSGRANSGKSTISYEEGVGNAKEQGERRQDSMGDDDRESAELECNKGGAGSVSGTADMAATRTGAHASRDKTAPVSDVYELGVPEGISVKPLIPASHDVHAMSSGWSRMAVASTALERHSPAGKPRHNRHVSALDGWLTAEALKGVSTREGEAREGEEGRGVEGEGGRVDYRHVEGRDGGKEDGMAGGRGGSVNLSWLAGDQDHNRGWATPEKGGVRGKAGKWSVERHQRRYVPGIGVETEADEGVVRTPGKAQQIQAIDPCDTVTTPSPTFGFDSGMLRSRDIGDWESPVPAARTAARTPATTSAAAAGEVTTTTPQSQAVTRWVAVHSGVTAANYAAGGMVSHSPVAARRTVSRTPASAAAATTNRSTYCAVTSSDHTATPALSAIPPAVTDFLEQSRPDSPLTAAHALAHRTSAAAAAAGYQASAAATVPHTSFASPSASAVAYASHGGNQTGLRRNHAAATPRASAARALVLGSAAKPHRASRLGAGQLPAVRRTAQQSAGEGNRMEEEGLCNPPCAPGGQGEGRVQESMNPALPAAVAGEGNRIEDEGLIEELAGEGGRREQERVRADRTAASGAPAGATASQGTPGCTKLSGWVDELAWPKLGRRAQGRGEGDRGVDRDAGMGEEGSTEESEDREQQRLPVGRLTFEEALGDPPAEHAPASLHVPLNATGDDTLSLRATGDAAPASVHGGAGAAAGSIASDSAMAGDAVPGLPAAQTGGGSGIMGLQQQDNLPVKEQQQQQQDNLPVKEQQQQQQDNLPVQQQQHQQHQQQQQQQQQQPQQPDDPPPQHRQQHQPQWQQQVVETPGSAARHSPRRALADKTAAFRTPSGVAGNSLEGASGSATVAAMVTPPHSPSRSQQTEQRQQQQQQQQQQQPHVRPLPYLLRGRNPHTSPSPLRLALEGLTSPGIHSALPCSPASPRLNRHRATLGGNPVPGRSTARQPSPAAAEHASFGAPLLLAGVPNPSTSGRGHAGGYPPGRSTPLQASSSTAENASLGEPHLPSSVPNSGLPSPAQARRYHPQQVSNLDGSLVNPGRQTPILGRGSAIAAGNGDDNSSSSIPRGTAHTPGSNGEDGRRNLAVNVFTSPIPVEKTRVAGPNSSSPSPATASSPSSWSYLGTLLASPIQPTGSANRGRNYIQESNMAIPRQHESRLTGNSPAFMLRRHMM